MNGNTQTGDWSRSGLDLIRFTLALTVALGHLTQALFQTSWPDLTSLAITAVGGFFVLSGYTIGALTLPSQGFDASRYLADRASRLLSVSILALLVTILADALSARMAPAYYMAHFGHDLGQPFLRLLANLFFVSQLWGNDMAPFSNSPFWSLSYEAGFYALWAAWMHWRRGRGSAIWLLAALVFWGPNIVFMMPFWLLGTALFVIGRWQLRYRAALSGVIVASAGLLMAAWLSRHLGEAATFKEAVKAGLASVFEIMHVRMAKVSTMVMSGAVAMFLALVPALTLAQWLNSVAPLTRGIGKRLQTLGNLTFPLYLLHFPLFVWARAGHFFDPASDAHKVFLLLALLPLSHACTKISDPFKVWMRDTLPTVFRTRSLPIQASKAAM